MASPGPTGCSSVNCKPILGIAPAAGQARAACYLQNCGAGLIGSRARATGRGTDLTTAQCSLLWGTDEDKTRIITNYDCNYKAVRAQTTDCAATEQRPERDRQAFWGGGVQQ